MNRGLLAYRTCSCFPSVLCLPEKAFPIALDRSCYLPIFATRPFLLFPSLFNPPDWRALVQRPIFGQRKAADPDVELSLVSQVLQVIVPVLRVTPCAAMQLILGKWSEMFRHSGASCAQS